MTDRHYSTLISVDELKALIETPELRLFDCRFYLSAPEKGMDEYQKGHIVNSQYAHLDQQLAGQTSAQTGRHPLPEKQDFEKQLNKWGVNESSQIIVYDDMNGAIAARLWWMCKWAGLNSVAVLDGGIQAWVSQDNELTKIPGQHSSSHYKAHFDDSLWLTTQSLQQLITDHTTVLTDARAKERYIGKVEPIDKVAGHVPGAINIPFDSNLDAHGCFKSKTELTNLHNCTNDGSNVIAMCGSGVTACHNILARAHAGIGMGKLYVGSWSEWITDSEREIQKSDCL